MRWIGVNVSTWQEVFLNLSAFLSEKPFTHLSGMRPNLVHFRVPLKAKLRKSRPFLPSTSEIKRANDLALHGFSCHLRPTGTILPHVQLAHGRVGLILRSTNHLLSQPINNARRDINSSFILFRQNAPRTLVCMRQIRWRNAWLM